MALGASITRRNNMGVLDLRGEASVHRGLGTRRGEERGHPIQPNSRETLMVQQL
jgi:hypothetical protein